MQSPPPQCHYADADLLVLDKPAGLLCVPGRGADKQDCLSARAQQHWGAVFIVHRLDQATSGLVLLARTPDMQRQLNHAFAQRQVDKRYHAIVCGQPEPAPDADGWSLIDLPLAADWPQRPRQKVDYAHGKPSQTRWRSIASHGATSLLELQPITGRTHQLRLHLAAIGHPIVGDRLYGAATNPAPRLLLHASALTLQHPRSGAWMHWHSTAEFTDQNGINPLSDKR